MTSLALLLMGSACAAAKESPEESASSLTVSSALEESSPVESQTAAFSESGAFTDVTPGNWFYEAVEYCRGNGLMAGKGSGRFSPNDNMTRAELATVLYRHAESPAVTVSPDFTDVKEDTWYTRAVAWAQESNIVSGYGNGRFGTNDPVRREDIAVIFWRYAGRPKVGKDAEFSDMSKVSGYALEAVDWARANGIVSGKGNNRFDPKGCANRPRERRQDPVCPLQQDIGISRAACGKGRGDRPGRSDRASHRSSSAPQCGDRRRTEKSQRVSQLNFSCYCCRIWV